MLHKWEKGLLIILFKILKEEGRFSMRVGGFAGGDTSIYINGNHEFGYVEHLTQIEKAWVRIISLPVHLQRHDFEEHRGNVVEVFGSR